MSDQITIDDVAKVDIRVGKVMEAREVPGSEKLIRQVVDFGELGTRIIFSGIKKWYTPEDLVGKSLPYIVNLVPRPMPSFVETSEGKFREESQGMLLAAAPEIEGEHTAVLITPIADVTPGTRLV